MNAPNPPPRPQPCNFVFKYEIVEVGPGVVKRSSVEQSEARWEEEVTQKNASLQGLNLDAVWKVIGVKVGVNSDASKNSRNAQKHSVNTTVQVESHQNLTAGEVLVLVKKYLYVADEQNDSDFVPTDSVMVPFDAEKFERFLRNTNSLEGGQALEVALLLKVSPNLIKNDADPFHVPRRIPVARRAVEERAVEERAAEEWAAEERAVARMEQLMWARNQVRVADMFGILAELFPLAVARYARYGVR